MIRKVTSFVSNGIARQIQMHVSQEIPSVQAILCLRQLLQLARQVDAVAQN